MVAVLKSLIWGLFTQQFQYVWIPTMNEGQKNTEKREKYCRCVNLWHFDRSRWCWGGGWVSWWKHISHYFQHPSPVSHAPPFVTHCSTNPQIPPQTNPKNQQNTKFLNMNISGLAWYIYTYFKSDCWSFVGLIVIHKIYTTVNQSKILNTFWLKIMNGTMGKFHKRDTKSSFLYQKEVSFISIYRRVSWDIWVKRSVDSKTGEK